MFLYFRKNGTVVMRSEGQLKSKLDYIEITPTLDEKDKLEQNYHTTVKANKLEFAEPDHIKSAKKKLATEEIKADIAKAKDLNDIKQILNRLL